MMVNEYVSFHKKYANEESGGEEVGRSAKEIVKGKIEVIKR
jgi:hypothetical protein